LEKHGVIRERNYTNKYTRSLNINLWLKRPFDLDTASRHVRVLRRKLNRCKKTPVSSFTEIKIVNVQGSGHIDSSINAEKWSKIELSNTSFYLEIGIDYNEPTSPISSFIELRGQQFRFINVCISRSDILRINNTGSFTVIAKTIEGYERLIDLLITIVRAM
jgi:hypothetical protein